MLHGELHERIQREETSRVVAMLQDADSGSCSQKDLVQRVRDMVAEGRDPESAQQEIVEAGTSTHFDAYFLVSF